jgi:hypothetical protein
MIHRYAIADADGRKFQGRAAGETDAIFYCLGYSIEMDMAWNQL